MKTKSRPSRIPGVCPAALMFWIILCSPSCAEAAETYSQILRVSPKGPVRSIQKAVDMARPGTVIKVGRGVYREQVVFKKSGTEQRPILLQGAIVPEGEQGTVIEVAAVRELKWEEAPDWWPDPQSLLHY